MKIDFSTVIFTDKSQEIFDGPDEWAKGWILSDKDMSVAKRRQQGVSCLMIWVEIVDQSIIGPFKVDEAVKLNSASYCDFMNKTFFSWHKSQSSNFKVKCVFMHNNAPFHVSKLTCELCEHKRFTGEKIMEWLPSSPDLNLIKNQWSIVKMQLYEGGKQCNRKTDL